MLRIALDMLFYSKIRLTVLVAGVSFATLLMTHQVSVFVGVMRRTTNVIGDIHPTGIWVMHPESLYVDEAHPLPEHTLQRILSIEGVAWASVLRTGSVRISTDTGQFRYAFLYGIDEELFDSISPPLGKRIKSLSAPDGILVDEAGLSYLSSECTVDEGTTLEINERRAVVQGSVAASPPFQTMPIVFTTADRAISFLPPERCRVSYILAFPQQSIPDEVVCRQIEQETGLLALTADQFNQKTIMYYVRNTGIPLNFAITVSIGFVVGIGVAGQSFYTYVVERLNEYSLLKAIGFSNPQLCQLVALQALMVATMGYAIGITITLGLIELLSATVTHLRGFHLAPLAMAGSATAMVVILTCACVLSLRRVFRLEPAEIFRA